MTKQKFYHSDTVPIELRSSENSKACYGKHTHEEFSIGAIDCGHSDYFNSNIKRRIQKGSLVIINPLEVHSCSPTPNTNWSYKMMYICPKWLGYVQSMVIGKEVTSFIPFSINYTDDPKLYVQFQELADTIILDNDKMKIEEDSISFFSNLFSQSNAIPFEKVESKNNVSKAYEYICGNFRNNISIKDVAVHSQLSEYHIIHAFRKAYGITPHAMQIVMRINEAKILLRQGMNIASVATELGFYDQSHFHRNFKKLVAATPAEYKKVSYFGKFERSVKE
ncbi:AraC family transcriptional regulator [Xenorhabdus sp. KK7.4]|uniref:AraC family transcriptional regulator n=1 Tax=Xenorhabdus sp. KK7.4 TaxID=1851572 RepID=UPI000C05145A|nr:AraC family transcriptional regulator [Xenorhabdus sp. KK7.4]PHM52798.1 putative transcriptional regulator [Xenorhabdus sp. KK7.4]